MNTKKWTTRAIVFSLSFMMLIVGAAVGQAPKAHATTASKASSIISLGKRYLGTPYRFGASVGQTRTFDCSSFTKYIYGKKGIYLPRTSKAQSKAGRYVSRSNLKPGDLVFFYKPIHHVAVYIGNGKIMHTYGKPGVTISSIRSGWWSKHYTTARRVG
ncbi:C40 family peptidase [Paenibacillus humicola]|uniref:C40 family peptidase n=1 Tax=Paenibacillus humicola TaxID=3110540 RepID=UPI00237C003A|nr:C40 family peptidase [Paenibacillus humicola]